MVQPLGLVGGENAAAAVEAGLARWLAGGPLAFVSVLVSEGTPENPDVEIRPVRDFARVRDSIISTRLDEISSPRAPCGGLSWGRTQIIGLLDLSTDAARDTKLAVAWGRMLARDGADAVAITIKAEGRAPGGADTELERVIPVIDGLAGQGIRTAIFTRYAEVMLAAANAGARFLADTGGFFDDEMLPAVCGLTQPFIIRPKLEMNAKYDPRSAVMTVHQRLEDAIGTCLGAGIDRSRLIVDPGVGTLGDVRADMALLSGLSAIHGLGCPLAVAAGRTGLVGAMTGEPDPQRRGPGDIVLTMEAMAQGAQILVAQNVSEAWQAAVAHRAVATGRVGDAG